MGELWRALAAWREIVGDAHLRHDPEARRDAARTTFHSVAAPACIVCPGSLAELQACMRVASECVVPVYPTSRGQNLGYGSRVPTRDGAALIDLRRLDRITDLDRELGCVTIEPGVTFAALAEQLRGSGYLIARTGAPRDASVLANSLERGIGRGRHGTRADRLAGLHVVLADGSLLRTGFDRFPDARARGLSRFGVGAALDGLFFQSRLGVVARATLWLTPRPVAAHELSFTLDHRERLAAVIDALRPLKLADAAPHTLSIYNDRRLLTITASELGRAGQLLAQDLVDRHNPVAPDARWLGQLTVDGASAAIADATLELVKTCLKDHVDRLDARKARERDPPTLASDTALARLYWRVGAPPALPDPLADGCGLLWCAPVLPARGAEVVAAIAWLEALVCAHGFDPAITLQWAEPRAIHLVLALLFDRRRPGEDRRALDCHDAVVRGLAARGLLPYRLGLPAMQLALETDRVHLATVAAIRRALDPGDILGPDRVRPEPAREAQRWHLGRVQLEPAELSLRAQLGASLVDLARQLPAALVAPATRFLELEARGRGADQILRKFPPPLWSFLLGLRGRVAAGVIAEAGVGQACALLLHLLDDHLCDGQLGCDHALLQLRTRAWSRFEAAISSLAEGLPGADAYALAGIERYFACVERPREPLPLADALGRARGEMATWSIVPALCAWRSEGVAARDTIASALERLMVAWRIVDDLDDLAADALAGAGNIVQCVLSPAGLTAWSACRENIVCSDKQSSQSAALGELLALVAREGHAPALASRAHFELREAALAADGAGWPRLGAQLLALAEPLLRE